VHWKDQSPLTPVSSYKNLLILTIGPMMSKPMLGSQFNISKPGYALAMMKHLSVVMAQQTLYDRPFLVNKYILI
jgi:hypothetical protein